MKYVGAAGSILLREETGNRITKIPCKMLEMPSGPIESWRTMNGDAAECW